MIRHCVFACACECVLGDFGTLQARALARLSLTEGVSPLLLELARCLSGCSWTPRQKTVAAIVITATAIPVVSTTAKNLPYSFMWQLVTTIWQLDADIYADGAYSTYTW
jgi:hypothetical protein